MKWICLILLLAMVHGLPEYSCPTITDVSPSQMRRLRHTESLDAINDPAINLAATDINIDQLKWPMGRTPDHKYEIPYAFHDSLPDITKESVYYGMVMIERGTNIIFVEKRESDENYILIGDNGSGACFSRVGDVQIGPQPIQLAKWCASSHSATHELLHAVGLHHEHQRKDRPIKKNTGWGDPSQFVPLPQVVGMTTYDPFSIMHYQLNGNFKLDKSKGWTDLDILKGSWFRAFPTLCDYYAINKLYKGLRSGPPCKNVEIYPMLLHATEKGNQLWDFVRGDNPLSMDEFCNWQGGQEFQGRNSLFMTERDKRDLCQLENNRMYPDLSWIPNAAEQTVPIAGVDYGEYEVSANRNPQEYPPQHMCDCLPAPPAEFTDNSMFQKCLECVHFESTTDGVLRCIAERSYYKDDFYAYLKGNYPNNYYVNGPQ